MKYLTKVEHVMNKKKLSVICSCFAVIALALSFHSCDLDEGGPSAQMFGFGTLREIDKSQEFYYVILDYEDKSLHLNKCPIPVNARNSGQRVAVTFEPLEDKVDGFDYNGNILQMDTVMTKPFMVIDEAASDTIGSDGVNMINYYIYKNYLHFFFQILNSDFYNRHDYNLVQVAGADGTVAEPVNGDGYVVLELRHRNYQKNGNTPVNGYVSFDISEIQSKYADRKGVLVKTRTTAGELVEYKYDFNTGKEV